MAHGRIISVRLKIWGRLDRSADNSAQADGFEGDIALLYQSEAPRLRRWLSARFAPDRAADLVQTAFVRVLRLGSARIQSLEHPRAYIYRVADNVAKNHGLSLEHRMEQQTAGDPSGSDDPHGALEARDLLRRIELAIPKLPDRTREIFMAHRFEDETYQQIADRLGISIKTVEYHISAALLALHRAVGSKR